MNEALLKLLRCPVSGRSLTLKTTEMADGQVRTGTLTTDDGQYSYPVRDFIPRFVPESNYADNFGMQWNLFSRTQLDSNSGHPISTERFWKSTGWSPEELRGKWVLDAGCGSGRFAEVALSAGANVVAIDYSSAADACFANLRQHANLHVVQADIYALPLERASFDFVYSLGVLQHTPDVEKAFMSLPPMVAAGGSLAADFYEMTWKHRLLPRHYLRPVTTRMDKTRLFTLLREWVPPMMTVSQAFGRVPGIGRLLVRAVPVADYTGLYPLDQRQLQEWALLDTFDWLSPTYDQPQNRAAVTAWIERAGFDKTEVLKTGFMVVRGINKR